MSKCPYCSHENPEDADFCTKCAARLVEGEDPFIGTVIERRYEILEKTAEGGMGAVYRAIDTRLENYVAIKILHPDLARDKKLLSRFESEAKTVAKLRHENIVLVHDTGPVRDTYFIVMDYLDGDDLVDIMSRSGPIPIEEAFSIVAQVADGLSYAHGSGVLHRDIKPANIIVDNTGRAVITDFGIAKAIGSKGQTTAGTSVGTPEYMSLEQIRGKTLDERTDIYSLGIVLYEMLTGRSPFRSDSGISALANVLSEEAKPLEQIRTDLPAHVVQVVNIAIAKDRKQRFASAKEFAEALRGGPVKVSPLASTAGAGGKPDKPEKPKPPKGAVRAVPGAESQSQSKRRNVTIVLLTFLIIIGVIITIRLFSGFVMPGRSGPVGPPGPVETVTPAKPKTVMFRGNISRTGIFNTDGVRTYTEDVLTFKTGGNILSSPTLSNNLIFFGSADKNLYAYDTKNDKVLWTYKAGAEIYSSPAVDSGVVYIGSDDGYLHAINAETGTSVWKFKSDKWINSSPVVSEGVVYVGSWDKNIYAINAKDGKKEWSYKTGGEIFSSPSISGETIYVGSGDGNLYAIGARYGNIRWKFKTGGKIFSSPAVYGGTVFFGSDDKSLYALTASGGKELWSFKTGGAVRSSPAVSKSVVYVGSWDKSFYAIDMVSGNSKWTLKVGGKISSSPAVAGGVVYVGSKDGYLYAVDTVNGSELWKYKTGNEVNTSPIISEGIVYFGSSDGYLYGVK